MRSSSSLLNADDDTCAGEGSDIGRSLEPERASHIDVEANAAHLSRVVEVEAAIARTKVDPRIQRIVDRAYDLPVGMSADAKSADIGIRRQAEAVAEIVVIAPGDSRIFASRDLL